MIWHISVLLPSDYIKVKVEVKTEIKGYQNLYLATCSTRLIM